MRKFTTGSSLLLGVSGGAIGTAKIGLWCRHGTGLRGFRHERGHTRYCSAGAIWSSGRDVALGGTDEAGKARGSSPISNDMSPMWELGPNNIGWTTDVDNNRVDRMDKIDGATEMGAFVGFKKWPMGGQSLTFARMCRTNTK